MPNYDAVGKGGWGGENVSKSDDVILVCSLITLKHSVLNRFLIVKALVGALLGHCKIS